jgi:valyl-tRNA synthetase
MMAPFPVAQLERIDAKADAWMAALKATIGACRNLRGEMGLSPADNKMPLLVIGDPAFVDAAAPLLKALAKVGDVRRFDDETSFAAATRSLPVAVAGELRLALHVEIDRAAEQARLGKEITRLRGQIAKAQAELGNEGFVARAPAAVIEERRQRLAEFTRALSRLEDQAARLAQST